MYCITSQPHIGSSPPILSYLCRDFDNIASSRITVLSEEVTKILSGNGNKNIEIMDHEI